MSNFNPAGGGLQYRGTNAVQPPNCTFDNRDPNSYDTQGFSLLDLWLNTVTKTIFCLVSLAGNSNSRRSIAIWAPIGKSGGDIFTLTGNDGMAVSPTSGNVNIVGANPVTVLNTSPSTLTIDVAAATTVSAGVVFLSSSSDTIAGNDTTTAVVPSGLKAKLGVQTLDGVAYGAGTAAAINWTAVGANDTVLTGTGGAPEFASEFTVGNIILNNFPVSPTDDNVATVGYANSIAAGFTFIASVRVATTANLTPIVYNNGAAGVGATITNNGAQVAISIDGVALSLNDRVLVKNQTTQFQNGVYTVTTVGTGATNWVLTRATDYDQAPAEIKPGNIVPVTAGTTNASTLWLQTATVTTIGTDAIIFVPFGIEPFSPLPISDGGTNATSFSTNDGTVYFDGTRLVTTATGTSGQVLTSNGAGVAPTYQNTGSGSGGTIVTTFNTPGPDTFTPNVNTKSLVVYGWGGGGGGGCGSTGGSQFGTTYTAGGGGQGGGAGGTFYYSFERSFIGASVNIIVASGGSGAPGVTNQVLGDKGTPGGVSYFGSMSTGIGDGGCGGDPGTGGVPVAGGAGTGYSNNSVFFSPSGGVGGGFPAQGINGASPSNSFPYMAPTSGGGGIRGLPIGSTSARGGNILNGNSDIVLAGGAADGGNGNAATTAIDFMCGGSGGGGGGPMTIAGGMGGFPGGGGGGGAGAAGTVTASGSGGDGADGLVIVIEYT